MTDPRLLFAGFAVVAGMLVFMTLVIAVAAKVADWAIRYADARDDEEAQQTKAAIDGYDR
jgi:hypothetical protein